MIGAIGILSSNVGYRLLSSVIFSSAFTVLQQKKINFLQVEIPKGGYEVQKTQHARSWLLHGKPECQHASVLCMP